LVPLIIICTVLSLLLLVLFGMLKYKYRKLGGLALAVGILGLLAAPAYWAYAPIANGSTPLTPFAGPKDVSFPTNNGKPIAMTSTWQKKWYEGDDLMDDILPKALADYLVRNDNGSRFLVAMPNVMYSAPLILDYGVSVMTMGGFAGMDKTITPDQFSALVGRGELQYYYLSMGGDPAITVWVKQYGKLIDPTSYGASSSWNQLYDLSGLKD
jgi:4-amino-4-deoxy-L-arabinose transferase-like glycosyltransferase